MPVRPKSTLLSEILLGGVQGFGISLAVWSLASYSASDATAAWPLALIAAIAGSLPIRSQRLGPISITLPIVALAQLLAGFPLAMACALLARLVDAKRSQQKTPLSGAHWLYELSSAAVAVSAAAGIYTLLAGLRVASAAHPLAALIGFALSYVIVDHGLMHLRLLCRQRITTVSRIRLLAWAAEFSIAVVTVPLLVNLHALAGGSGWIWITLLTLLGFAAGVTLGRRRSTHAAVAEDSTDVHKAIARALAHSLVVQDRDLRRHIDRVRETSVAMGKRFGLSVEAIRSLEMAAILHDIGKIAVPRRILDKPTRLNADEWRQVRMHPGVGAEIISCIDFPEAVQAAVRHHHERWDGTGYPDGLAGEEIPIGARILSAVDCFDALVSDRPYRAAYTHSGALDHLREQSGKMFDPNVVEGLIDHILSEQPAVGLLGHGTDDEDDEFDAVASTRLSMNDHEDFLRTMYEMERIAEYSLSDRERWTLLASETRRWLPHLTLVVYGNEDGQRLVPLFASGVASEEILRFQVSASNTRLAGLALAERRVVNCVPCESLGPRPDMETLHDLDGIAGSEELLTLRNGLATALIRGGRAVGVLALYDDADRQFSAGDEQRIASLCGPFAAVAGQRGGHTATGRLPTSLTDPLTGLPNARYLRIEAARRLSVETGEHPCGLIALEFDGLEHLQTHAGPDACRRVVIELARRIALQTTSTETPIRIGWKTFVILTPQHESGQLVKRWRELVRRLEEPPILRADGEPIPVRVCASHVSWPDDGIEFETLMSILTQRLASSRHGDRTVVPFELLRTGTRNA